MNICVIAFAALGGVMVLSGLIGLLGGHQGNTPNSIWAAEKSNGFIWIALGAFAIAVAVGS